MALNISACVYRNISQNLIKRFLKKKINWKLWNIKESGNFTTGLAAQVASYHSTTLELRATHSFTNVCRNSVHT